MTNPSPPAEKEAPWNLTPETAQILVHYLYRLIDDIQFRYCPYESPTSVDDDASSLTPDDSNSL